MDVIFHIDEPAKWPVVLSNLHNYITAATDEGVLGEIELLVNGSAITGVTQASSVAFADLQELGVTVAACSNAMRGHAITSGELKPGVLVVPAGVVELVKKQHAGFAYIKP
ncbi:MULTISPECIES: DsrE family protein [Lacticaseibacillus]|uniref:DsrE family protein n=2 Tax=Lacticaseibacillus TaxID=2759736 RepID=A0ABW4CKM3_9LACO|nr:MULTISPECIES: DsrE family protein [Lacticaseibacillus]